MIKSYAIFICMLFYYLSKYNAKSAIKILHLQSLDEVHIDVETCEDLRSMSSPQGVSSYTGPAKYSFIHKVIDGITIAVNTVLVTFKSPAFIASVQVWCYFLVMYNIYNKHTIAQ